MRDVRNDLGTHRAPTGSGSRSFFAVSIWLASTTETHLQRPCLQLRHFDVVSNGRHGCPSDSRGTTNFRWYLPLQQAHYPFILHILFLHFRPMCSRRVSRCREFYSRAGARYRAPFQSHRALPCRGRCCGRRELRARHHQRDGNEELVLSSSRSRRRPDTVEKSGGR